MMKARPALRWLILPTVLVCGGLVASRAVPVITAIYVEETADRAENTVGLAVSVLQGQLDRFRQIPALLAEQQNIQLLVGQPDDPVRIAAMNAYLAATTTVLEASDIYVMQPDGTTIAASNHDQPASFVGENFAYRPYFTDAITGGRGQFFGIGTTSLRRGYYFSAPVRTDTGVAGVIALKVDVSTIENDWTANDYEIVVTDPNGIVFMAGRADWRFSALRPLTADRIRDTNHTRRYADATLTELPLTTGLTRWGRPMMRIGRGEAATEYVVVSQTMPDAGWTVKVLADTAPARAQARVVLAMIFLTLCLAVAGGLLLRQRRSQVRERLAHQREAQEELERRVKDRTRDLDIANRRLEQEVIERRSTEEALRKTQGDFIQAAKLAALGQMSAELSHEFNQPLAALRSYIGSMQTLVARDRMAEAAQYLMKIDGLTGRMTAISRHLSAFARRPGEQLSAVPVAEVVADAMALLDWRIRAEGVRVIEHIAPVRVHAGRVRLQQVLVNILSNAIDATQGRDTRDIHITVTGDGNGGQATIAVRDTGAGVPEAILPRIFDPFFSTKGVGRGLGLGLSISYNIIKDFGGALTIHNTDGGTEVQIRLPLAPQSLEGRA